MEKILVKFENNETDFEVKHQMNYDIDMMVYVATPKSQKAVDYVKKNFGQAALSLNFDSKNMLAGWAEKNNFCIA